MKKSTIITLLGCGCLILFGFIIKQCLEIAGQKKTMASLINAKDKALQKHHSSENENIRLQKAITASNDQLKHTRDALGELEKESRRKLAGNDESKEGEKNELDRWFGAVAKLKNFMKYNPNYIIPEFKYLTAKDWLAATEGGMLKSEADYRAALAELRQSAKLAVSEIFGQAVKDFANANNGNAPTQLSDIANYLPGDFDPGILERYETNPSGVCGIDTPKAREQQWIIKETNPTVDGIWDSEIWVSSSGKTALHDISAVVGGAVESVQNAIAAYKNDHGAEPSSVDQINAYINARIKKNAGNDKISEVFRSLMNK